MNPGYHFEQSECKWIFVFRFFLGATLHTVEGSVRLSEGEIHFDPDRRSATGDARVDARSWFCYSRNGIYG